MALKRLNQNENARKHFFAVLFVFLSFALIVLNCAIILTVSANYNEIYDMPRNIGGAADYAGFSYESRNTKPSLAGEWEFFYNKWIETDQLPSAAPDCMVKVPGKWTGTEVGGEKIGADGYASYRMTLKNVPAGMKVNVNLSPKHPIVYRTFLNGYPNNSSGLLSKEIGGSLMDGRRIFADYYVPQAGEDVIVVVEVANTALGGLVTPPKLSIIFGTDDEQSAITKYNFIGDIPFVVFGVMLTLVIMQLIMSLALYGRKKEMTGVLLIAALFMHFVFSKDMFAYIAAVFINVMPLVFYFFNFLTAFLVVAAFSYHLYRTGLIAIKKPYFLTIIGTLGLEFIAYFLLAGSTFQFIPLLTILLTAGIIVYRLSTTFTVKNRSKLNTLAYVLLFTALLCLLTLEGLDFMGMLVFGMETAPSYVILVSMIALSTIYLVKMRQNTRLALAAAQYEKEYNEMKHTAMRGQIKPHFIFNSLTSIQNQYHNGIREGDAALSLFSKHLRLNTDADMKDLIPFEDELVNINNYFNLENLRFGGKLNLLFDIDYTEFLVPILGLQPLVENAVKYAETNKIPDGFIKISTVKQDDKIILTVKDNGKGFAPAQTRDNSQGIKNVTARFAYYLNATTFIGSKPGEGTEIQIIIPLKGRPRPGGV